MSHLVHVHSILSFSLVYFILNSPWTLIVNLVATLGIMVALMMKRKEYPFNYYLLGAFVSIMTK